MRIIFFKILIFLTIFGGAFTQAQSLNELAYSTAHRIGQLSDPAILSWNDRRLVERSFSKINGILNKYENCRYDSRRPECNDRHRPPGPPHGRIDRLCIDGLRDKRRDWPSYEIELSCTDTDTRCVFAVTDMQKYWRSVELTGLCSTKKAIDKACVIHTVRYGRYNYASDIEKACSTRLR